MDRVEKRYGIKVEKVYSALTPEKQERQHGAALWSRDPDRCCGLRKVEPLKTKLAELAAWIAAIRRDQTSSRASARKIEWDAKFQLVKINPIADWTSAMVWSYALRHNVPYNPLHDQNYPSSRMYPLHPRRRPRGKRSSRALGRVRKNRVRDCTSRPRRRFLPWSKSRSRRRSVAKKAEPEWTSLSIWRLSLSLRLFRSCF